MNKRLRKKMNQRDLIAYNESMHEEVERCKSSLALANNDREKLIIEKQGVVLELENTIQERDNLLEQLGEQGEHIISLEHSLQRKQEAINNTVNEVAGNALEYVKLRSDFQRYRFAAWAFGTIALVNSLVLIFR